MFKICFSSQAWWHIPIHLATWETKTRESQVQSQLEQFIRQDVKIKRIKWAGVYLRDRARGHE